MDSVLALHPAATGSIPGVPNNFSEFLMLQRFIDGAAAQSSGQQRHKNVDQSHLVIWLVASRYCKNETSLSLETLVLSLLRSAKLLHWVEIKNFGSL